MKDDACVLALEPEPTQKIITAVRNTVNNLPKTSINPVIMVKQNNIRRPVRKLVELEFPHLVVMEENEIISSVNSLDTIKLD